MLRIATHLIKAAKSAQFDLPRSIKYADVASAVSFAATLAVETAVARGLWRCRSPRALLPAAAVLSVIYAINNDDLAQGTGESTPRVMGRRAINFAANVVVVAFAFS